MLVWKILVVAALVEAITENIVWLWKEGWKLERIIALVVGIAVCVLSGLDLFMLVDIPLAVPYVGSVLTGFLVTRGGNAVHDLLKLIGSLKETIQLDVTRKEDVANRQPVWQQR